MRDYNLKSLAIPTKFDIWTLEMSLTSLRSSFCKIFWNIFHNIFPFPITDIYCIMRRQTEFQITFCEWQLPRATPTRWLPYRFDVHIFQYNTHLPIIWQFSLNLITVTWIHITKSCPKMSHYSDSCQRTFVLKKKNCQTRLQLRVRRMQKAQLDRTFFCITWVRSFAASLCIPINRLNAGRKSVHRRP